MIIPDKLTSELEKLIAIFDKCYMIISQDKFRYNEDQLGQVHSIRFEFEKLDTVKIDTFLANLKNSNIERSTLNGLSKKLTDYIKKYNSKFNQIEKFNKSILIDTILSPYKFDEKITALETSILEIEDEKNKMPAWLKEKECNSFRNELKNLRSIRDKHLNDLSYVLNDYYRSLFLNALEIEQKIDDYFPNENLELGNDLFKRKLISDLYEILTHNEIVSDKQLTFENLYLILNLRKPIVICNTSINKKTLFAFPIIQLSKSIENNTDKENWLEFVAGQLGLKVSSIKSHGHKNEKFTIFYDLFDIK